MIKVGDVIGMRYCDKTRCLVVDITTNRSNISSFTTQLSVIQLGSVENNPSALDISKSKNYHYSVQIAAAPKTYPDQKIIFKSSSDPNSAFVSRLVFNESGELFYAYDFNERDKFAFLFNIRKKKLSKVAYFDLQHQYQVAPKNFQYIYQPSK